VYKNILNSTKIAIFGSLLSSFSSFCVFFSCGFLQAVLVFGLVLAVCFGSWRSVFGLGFGVVSSLGFLQAVLVFGLVLAVCFGS
jgi:hypothetical protein